MLLQSCVTTTYQSNKEKDKRQSREKSALSFCGKETMKKSFKTIMILLIIIGLIMPQKPMEAKAAAQSYEDAEIFYDTCTNQTYFCEFADDGFYFATRGKAGSIRGYRYQTIAWRVTVSGNGYSMYVDVKENGHHLKWIDGAYGKKSDTKDYWYDLYGIKYEDISYLMNHKDADLWDKVCSGSTIDFCFDAIVTYSKPNETALQCTVTETQISSNPNLYDISYSNESARYYLSLRGDEGIDGLQKIFTRATFEEYKDIHQELRSGRLTLTYDIGAGNLSQAGLDASFNLQNGSELWKTESGTNKRYKQQTGRAGLLELLPTTYFDYPGYRLVPQKEWKYKNPDSGVYSYFEAGKATYAGNIRKITIYDVNATLEANWEPIQYQIRYEPNGGSGAAQEVNIKYDTTHVVRQCGYSRTGYTFTGWLCSEDGKIYQPEEVVKNLTTTYGKTVTFTAQWQHNTYEKVLLRSC